MIRRTLRLIFMSVYSALFFCAAVLAGLLLYFGPFIGTDTWAPFDTLASRLIWAGVIFVVFFLVALTIFLLRRRREKKMTEDIVESVDTGGEGEATGELAELRSKLKAAMAALRKSKNGRRHLAELPWYVMIGPPGAGKTTAIVNSGLQFPLAEEIGKTAVGGVGGTRNCDWWFTDQAVLIDTAGRYTTQESDAELDNAAWLGFLGLLKRHRKRQPINGAMVAISLSDLLMSDEQTRAEHARAVRRRLNELREKLGVRFPVYVLFTKADLIAGFTEFYDTLGKEEREQVWGFTLPLDAANAEVPPVGRFDEEFAGLLAQLNAQLLEKMQNETDHQRRSLIAGFPGQVASLRRVARDFLTETFQDNRYEARHQLRGVYLTSGTQEGTPIDRLMLSMARTFGIGRQAIGTGRGTGRSFFLTRLFEEVIFPEAGLVSADDRVERRYRVTKWGAIAATILAAVALGALLTRSYLGNSALIAEAQAHAAAYTEAAAVLPPSPVGDTDLRPVVEALNVLRDMPANPVVDAPDPEGRLRYGLYQGEVIGSAASQTYRAALNQRFLPRLLLRLEEQITANVNEPDVLYEALKVYMMLGLEGPMNADLVRTWMNLDWTVSFPGPQREEFRADLGGHLDALLSQPMQKIELNGPLVEQVQGILAEMPLAQRVYNGILASDAATALPEWRLTDVGGPAIGRVFIRSSGEPLSEGIRGIFTYRGFNEVFLGEALGVAERIQRDSWVLGPRGEAEQNELALARLSRDVLDLYYNDYISRYDGLLGEIDIVPLESLAHAVEVTNVLSGPTSPIVNVLDAVAQETKLTESRGALAESELGQTARDVVGIEAEGALSIQGQMLLQALARTAQAEGGPPPDPPGSYVEERFAWLHTLTERQNGQPSQLDEMMARLTEVYQELNKMSFAGVTSPDGGSALARFQEAAARIDGPVPRWASQITAGSSGITAEGTRATFDARWKAGVLPFCQQVTENRYPFNRRAQADVAMTDFTRLFGPSGLIDAFFQENLAEHVDMRTRPWTWKSVNDADLGISQQVLEQLQHAHDIKEAFFPGGGGANVQFQITPEALDPSAESVTLEIDGQSLSFRHRGGLPTPLAVRWPGPVGLARVVFEPSSETTESVLSRDGPWAAFRLFDAAEVRNTNVADRKRVIFNIGGRIAIYQMQTGSVRNPFALPALAQFSCPSSF